MYVKPASVDSRVAIMFEDAYGRGKNLVLPEQVQIHVMYWQKPVTNELPKLVYAMFEGSEESGRLVLGGSKRLITFKNASIGRRTCPECAGKVSERGSAIGTCSDCGKSVDYIKTSFSPYFYYFKTAEESDMHVGHDSPEYPAVESLKEALQTLPTRDIVFPMWRNGWADCDIPSFNKPTVFDRDQVPLHGTFNNTQYDLRIVV